MRKLFARLIAVLFVSCGFAFGQENDQAPGFLSYTLDGNSITITDCDASASGELIIPSTIEGKLVTKIGSEAFKDCSNLTSIIIPDSVTSIGNNAFTDCTSLTSISIPNSIKSIGDSTFTRCTSLTSITIPDGVTSIGVYAFDFCTSLTSVTIPDRVTSIGKSAFWSCTSLTSITIPGSVTSIGDQAFSGCYELQDFIFLGNAPILGENVFESADGRGKITISSIAEGYGETFGGVTVVATTVVSKPIRVFNVTSEPFGFSFNTTVDRSYTVEATGDLRRWEAVELFQGSGGEIRFTAKPTSSGKSHFFRVLVE